MAKVLVINSPLFREKNHLYDEDSLPPIGLGLIATALQKRKHDVTLVDAVAENIPLLELIEITKKSNPDFVAINIFTTNFLLVKEFVEYYFNKNIVFIIGGLSTRTLYENIFQWKIENEVIIVFGDGELITPDIVSYRTQESPNATFKNKKFYKIDSNSKYYCHNIDNIQLNREFFQNEPIKHPLGFLEANIITSRGCIYNCSFCAAARSLNRDLTAREMSAQCIIRDLNEIKKFYPNVESIRVLDDLFLKNHTTIKKAITVFSSFNLKWRSMAHVMTFKGVPVEDLKLLKSTGCSELFIGIESGSPAVLRRIHKTHDINVIKRTLVAIFEAGISIKGYFIYGFPNETKDDFEKTLELASYLKNQSEKFNVKFRTSVFQFRPYHGTELYHQIFSKNDDLRQPIFIEANSDLSNLVGRLQFNFHSGNYSAEAVEIVHEYIYKTANLTNTEQWGLN